MLYLLVSLLFSVIEYLPSRSYQHTFLQLVFLFALLSLEIPVLKARVNIVECYLHGKNAWLFSHTAIFLTPETIWLRP